MADDVKWIKISTDIFSNEKILLIESQDNSDSIIVIWFKLLCLAGRQNNKGVFVMSNGLPYTAKMLATIFKSDVSIVESALNIFAEFGMIDIDDDVISIPNWGKYQNLEQLEKKKEYQKEYQAKYRKQQKEQKDQCVNVDKTFRKCLREDLQNIDKTFRKSNVNTLDKEREKEGDKEREGEERDREKVDCQLIADMYNCLCPSLPSIKALSDARRKAIKARMKQYAVADFEVMFRKAEESDFLKGANNRNWQANFDWLMKDTNFAKVIDGNYDARNHFSQPQNKAAQELDDFYKRAAAWAEEGNT